MVKTEKRIFPRWVFAILAVGGLLAAGIFMGIMSVEGFSGLRFAQATGFSIFGLLMFWGALSRT
jgi:hypothetical protein